MPVIFWVVYYRAQSEFFGFLKYLSFYSNYGLTLQTGWCGENYIAVAFAVLSRNSKF